MARTKKVKEVEETKKGKSFVKWVGGKGQLAKHLDKFLPRNISDMEDLVYVDAFVGGGSMLFYMLQKYPNIKHAIINDINSDLVCCYNAIKNFPEQLIQLLKSMEMVYKTCMTEDERRTFYDKKRKLYNSKLMSPIENAALFIFLNRTCYNGVYRVNRKGEFNVPFGRYADPTICDEDLIRRDSELLKDVEIHCGDYKNTLEYAAPYLEDGKNVLFYFDPPYRPISKTACFTGFDKTPFRDEHQEELCDLCKEIDMRGGKFLLSNSDGHSINPDDTFLLDLYHTFNIGTVMASRNINAKGDGRAKISELTVWNYGATKEIDE